jgi:hypothetical protein
MQLNLLALCLKCLLQLPLPFFIFYYFILELLNIIPINCFSRLFLLLFVLHLVLQILLNIIMPINYLLNSSFFIKLVLLLFLDLIFCQVILKQLNLLIFLSNYAPFHNPHKFFDSSFSLCYLTPLFSFLFINHCNVLLGKSHISSLLLLLNIILNSFICFIFSKIWPS